MTNHFSTTRNYFTIREKDQYGAVLWEGYALTPKDAFEGYRVRHNLNYAELERHVRHCHISDSHGPIHGLTPQSMWPK